LRIVEYPSFSENLLFRKNRVGADSTPKTGVSIKKWLENLLGALPTNLP
jgi:hypothetical protein